MVMPREDHESLLNELMNTELDHTRRTEILQQLRVDYNNVHTEQNELTQTKEKLTKDNEDLIVSNSKLFRQLGVVGSGDPATQKKEEEKSFSENVTIEQLEKG